MKKTVIGLLLSATIISSAGQANALFGLFEDEKSTLQTERRAPVLNQSGSAPTVPNPNMYGSMPQVPQGPIDYPMAAPTPEVMQMPTPPQIPQPPQFTPAQPLTPPQFTPPQMATPSMPPMPQIPEPPAYIPVQPMNTPPVAPQNYVGADGYPKLSSIPQSSGPSVTVSRSGTGTDPRIADLKTDLMNSQRMAGNAPVPNVEFTPPAQVNVTPPQPVGVPQMPLAQAPMTPMPPAPPADFMPLPPPAPAFTPAPSMAAAPYTPAPMASASVTPVFPTGPSVTVRSKRAGGGASYNTASIQPQGMPSSLPMPPSNYDIAPVPTPQVQSAPITSAPAAMSYPDFSSQQPKFVGEASAPVASAIDSPNNFYSDASFATPSPLMAPARSNVRSAAMLPASRYERYRKTGQR